MPAYVPLTAYKRVPFLDLDGCTWAFVGENWTGAAFAMHIRVHPGDTGTAVVSLAGATAGTQGISVVYDADYIYVDDGVEITAPASLVLCQIDEATLEALALPTPTDEAATYHYDLHVTPSGGTKRVVAYGEFILKTGRDGMTQAIIVKREGAYVVTAAGAEVVASLLAQAQSISGDIQVVVDNQADIANVSANIAAINTTADNMAAILAAPGAAADVATAAASIVVQAPAYANTGGQGARTSIITVTVTGITGAAGTPDNLVDGTAASNATDGYRLPASTAVSGMALRFDFGNGARKLITEIVAKFQSTNSLATWGVRASNDASNWTVLGSSFTLASATTQTITAPSANVLGYRYYEIYGISGSTSATLNYIQEIEFKIASTSADGVVPFPAGGTVGQFAEKNSSSTSDIVWRDPKEPAGRSLFNHLWLCDEGHGTTLRDSIGGVHFNLAGGATEVNLGSGGSIAWDKGELLLTNAAIATGSTTVTSGATFVIYESVPDADHYVIGIGTSNNHLRTGTRMATVAKVKMLHGLGVRDPVTNGNNSMFGFACGGTMAGMGCETTPASGYVVVNANRNTDWAGMISSPIRILMIATMATEPTNDQAAIAQAFLDWHMAQRGRILTGKYAKKRCAVAVWTGESTHHTSLVMALEGGLTEAMRKQNYEGTNLMVAMGSSALGTPQALQRLSYWMDELDSITSAQMGNEGGPLDGTTATDDRNRKMGPLYGFAEKERYANTPKEHPIFHFKMAQGGKLIAPFGSNLAAGGTVALIDTFGAEATTGATLFTQLQCAAYCKFEAQLRRQGYGIDYITRYDARGLNDAHDLAAGVITSSATVQGWLQTEHDRFRKFIGVTALDTYTLVPHLPIPGAAENYAAQLGQAGETGGYTNDAAGQVRFDNLLYFREGVRDFADANADVTAVEGDDYGTNRANGDSVHMPFTGMATYGGDSRRRFGFTTMVSPLVDMS